MGSASIVQFTSFGLITEVLLKNIKVVRSSRK